ncbi:MAG: carbon-nitrogen hydrolase family protein [Planctomycetota bacterium]|nr:MAG: carbon-nitrogen hydrolase family protein [Planctomycetota bacterium]
MRIAGVQMDVRIADVAGNTEAVLQWLQRAAEAGAELVVFPECVLTGYCFESAEEALAVAQDLDGEAVRAIVEACERLRCLAVFGLLERAGERYFNAALLAGPGGVLASYRKVHLPYLGADRFAAYGDRPFAVHEVSGVRLGLNICYDSSFPEASRVLALLGADVIALPTNWPPGAECVAEHAIATRAMENGIYYAAINRVGRERGYRFIGRSVICGPDGEELARAGAGEEALLIAEVDPRRARDKLRERVPGRHIIDRFGDRRPEFYEAIVRPHGYPRSGGRVG